MMRLKHHLVFSDVLLGIVFSYDKDLLEKKMRKSTLKEKKNTAAERFL